VVTGERAAGSLPSGGREKRYRAAGERRGRLRICVSYGSTTFAPVRGGHVGAGALPSARRDTLLVPPRVSCRRRMRARTCRPVRHEKRMLQDRNTDDAYIPYARQEVA
jgi:hypothetical protein